MKIDKRLQSQHISLLEKHNQEIFYREKQKEIEFAQQLEVNTRQLQNLIENQLNLSDKSTNFVTISNEIKQNITSLLAEVTLNQELTKKNMAATTNKTEKRLQQEAELVYYQQNLLKLQQIESSLKMIIQQIEQKFNQNIQPQPKLFGITTEVINNIQQYRLENTLHQELVK